MQKAAALPLASRANASQRRGANHNPFANPRCGTCPNIGICGGQHYCKPNPCDLFSYFLRFFADRYPEAPELFEVE